MRLLSSQFLPLCRRLLSYQFPVNIVELEAVVERVAIQARAAHDEEAAAEAAALGLTAPLPAAVAGSQSTAGGATALYAQGSRRSCSGAACGGTNACGGTGNCEGDSQPVQAGQAAMLEATGPTGAEPLELSNEDFWFATQARLALEQPLFISQ